MKKRFFPPDALVNLLIPILVILLYLALLVGRDGLGWAYLPAVALSGAALAGLCLHRLHRQADLGARLRVDAPLLLLGGLVLLALVLRLLRMPEARPAPGSDEAYFVGAALDIIRSGRYIPASLRYPPLFIYGELAVSILRFLTGVSANLWTWPTELLPEHLYSWNRAMVALLGAATLLPVYWIGERRYGRRAGLLAAFFLALLPMHLAASGIVTPEVLAALLATLTVLFSLRLLEEPDWRWALAAGAGAGLAWTTHYPAGLVLLVPLLASWLRPVRGTSVPRQAPDSLERDEPDGPAAHRPTTLFILTAALLVFVLACPAVILDLDHLVAGLAEATRAYFPAEGGAGTGLRYLLQEGLGYGPALLTLLGAVLLLPRVRRQEIVIFSFPAAIYVALLLPRARFPRDLVLLAPWLALIAALGLDQIATWAGHRWPEQRLLQRWLPWGLALLGGGLGLLA